MVVGRHCGIAIESGAQQMIARATCTDAIPPNRFSIHQLVHARAGLHGSTVGREKKAGKAAAKVAVLQKELETKTEVRCASDLTVTRAL